MQIQNNSNYKLNISSYLMCKTEFIIFFLVFVSVFFQLFPYYEGYFIVTYYLPTLVFIIYFSLQIVGLEKLNINKSILFIYFLFFFWMFYGLGSLFFTLNHDFSFTTMHYKFIYFFNFYVITQFLSSESRIRFFEKLIIICILWNLSVSIWEITTLTHLPPSKYYNIPHYIPTGAFYNENDLPAALLICTPIILFMKGKYIENLCTILFLLLYMVIGFHATRIVLITLAPFLIYRIIFKMNLLFKLTALVIIFFSAMYIFSNIPMANFLFNKHIKERVASFGLEANSQRISSTTVRSRLYLISIEQMINSKGLGVGMGNFDNSFPYDRLNETDHVIQPHNFFFEILGSEGIPGFFLLCFIVFTPLLTIIKNKNRDSIFSLLNIKSLTDTDKRVLLFFLFFVISSASPSSIRNYFIYWTILAYNYALTYNTKAYES
ncbi:MAG: O-antigen ligase family protein [Candidatus Cloacimonetes bacterium]|nr:O-antigen ligase family protein [Candidatus Cloacimonadota bacterium]